MSKFMTYDYWVDNFKPIKNTVSKYPDDSLIHFETYGDEVDFVKAQYEINPKTIWTEVDGDEGTYIVAGYHFVNRINYYITENAWDDEWTEIPTWAWRECDCVERVQDGILEYSDGYDPNCEECEEGLVNISCDTVEDLKQIYGEDNEDIVG
jgi:hypothetical protein